MALGVWAASAGTAVAYPTTPCAQYNVVQVTGGNNQLTGHPGNPNSNLWIKGQGVQFTFTVPGNPTVRHDCLVYAAGLGAKMIFLNANGDPSGNKLFVGLHYENHYTNSPGEPFIYEDLEWGVITGSHNDNADFDFSPSKQVIGFCNLTPGSNVTLRIRAYGTEGFVAECYAGSGVWYSMMPSHYYIPPYPSGLGVELVERWRAGTSGGLNLDASNLKQENTAGNWVGWTAANCWQNSSTDYFFDNGTTSFSIYAGTPNATC